MGKKPTSALAKDVLNRSPEFLINWFDDFGTPDNDFRFLSNFYIGEPIVYAGDEYMTGEHLFQAMKAITERDEEKVRKAKSPGEAKKLGRRLQLRPDWEEVKYDVMAIVVRHKFARDRAEAKMLLDTGDALLMEGTFWGDQVWGIDLSLPTWPGRNWLGTLLMARRAELRADKDGRAITLDVYDGHVKAAAWHFQMESFNKVMDD